MLAVYLLLWAAALTMSVLGLVLPAILILVGMVLIPHWPQAKRAHARAEWSARG